jgi:hypothetical protein
MIISEDAARNRWCPHARSFYHNGSSVTSANRDIPGGNIPACIASHCLAWRWAEAKRIKDIDLVTSDVVDLPPRLGFCGLSGIPQHED